jgi:hypothetical protein
MDLRSLCLCRSVDCLRGKPTVPWSGRFPGVPPFSTRFRHTVQIGGDSEEAGIELPSLTQSDLSPSCFPLFIWRDGPPGDMLSDTTIGRSGLSSSRGGRVPRLSPALGQDRDVCHSFHTLLAHLSAPAGTPCCLARPKDGSPSNGSPNPRLRGERGGLQVHSRASSSIFSSSGG